MRPPNRIQGKTIWTPQDAADARNAAHEQPCEVGFPDQGTDAAHMNALISRAKELAAAATHWRRQRYAEVFARHAYQGGWSKDGAVKCRCGWNADIDTGQDKLAMAKQAYTLWSQHLAEVVVT